MNIFVSRPTSIRSEFENCYETFHKHLSDRGLFLRRLGRSDYSKKPPLLAVIDLINECSGAIVLGYPHGVYSHYARRGDQEESNFKSILPTPWNQIEAALAYACQSPVLVIAHPGIEGGVFDHGVTGEYVLHIDLQNAQWFESEQFNQPFEQWLAEVRMNASRKK